MTIIDFFIGLTLMNAMPHFVLGVWKGRMLSGLGIGNWQNIAYGLINFGIAMGLFMFKYGIAGFLDNGIMIGSLFTLILYFILGVPLYKFFHKRHYELQSATPETGDN